MLCKLTAFGIEHSMEHYKEIDTIRKTFKQHTKLNFKVPVCLCDSVQTEIFEKKKRLTDNSEKHLLNIRQKDGTCHRK